MFHYNLPKMAGKRQKAVISEWVKAWLTILCLSLLFYMYAYYTGGKTSRQIPIEAHLYHFSINLFALVATLEWGFNASTKAYRFLFLSFAIFRCFALLHRVVAYIFDMVLVTDTPTYSVLAFIALIFGGYDYYRRRDIESNRTSEC